MSLFSFLLGKPARQEQKNPQEQFKFFSGTLNKTFKDVFARASEATSSPQFAQANALAAQLPDLLRNSALASTTGAQVSALNAARLSGAGGRGLALGGAGRTLATRAATQAAIGQEAVLAQALAQGLNAQIATLLQTGSAGVDLKSRLLQALLAGQTQLGTTGLAGALTPISKGRKGGLLDVLGQLSGSAAKAYAAFK